MLKEQTVICSSETFGWQPNNNSRVENKRYLFIAFPVLGTILIAAFLEI